MIYISVYNVYIIVLSCLQFPAPAREGALQGQVDPLDGRLLGVVVHAVEPGAAPLLHQAGRTRRAQCLLQLLHKLEQCPGEDHRRRD